MKNLFLFIMSGFVFVGLSACSMKGGSKAVNKSIVKLSAKSGSKVNGTLYLEDHYGGVIISGKVSGLKPGPHGFHVHEVGNCKSKDGSSAGGHFHSEGQSHGDKGATGSHHGDLGNIEAKADGTAELNIFVKGLRLREGEGSIANRSLVIHADVDDLKSQPAGNSGARVACGVVEVKACDSGCSKDEGCSKSEGCAKKDCGCAKRHGKKAAQKPSTP